jgi:hypothetical protein
VEPLLLPARLPTCAHMYMPGSHNAESADSAEQHSPCSPRWKPYFNTKPIIVHVNMCDIIVQLHWNLLLSSYKKSRYPPLVYGCMCNLNFTFAWVREEGKPCNTSVCIAGPPRKRC